MLQDDDKSNTEGDSEWNKELIDEIRKKEGKSRSITEKDRIERLQECLDEGANVDVVDRDDKDDNTALHIAVEKGYKEVAQFLVRKGAKTDMTNKHGHTALTLAKALGKEDILNAITELKANQDSQSSAAERSSPSEGIVSLASQRTSASQDEALMATDSSIDSPESNLKRKAARIEDTKNTKKRGCETSNFDLQIKAHCSKDSHSEEDNDGEINRQGTSVFEEGNGYAASGLKQTLHGNIYQLKLLMLFVKRGLQEGYAFRLATEMDAAGKFDDVVFLYADGKGSGTVCRYLQAKHSQVKSRTISTSDLMNTEERDFSLQKYFVSYRKITKHPELGKSKFGDCILCTNIDFDLGNSKHEQSKFRVQKDDELDLRPEDLGASEIGLVKVGGFDAILDVRNSPKQSARYKLILNNRHELHETLRESSDAYLLAKTLAKHALNKTKMTLRTEIFKSYHIALATHVIDVKKKCFSTTFSNNDKNLSPEVRRFRKILGAEFLKFIKLHDGNVSEGTMRARIRKAKLEFSEYFGQEFKSKGSNLTNLKEFSEAFVRLIRKANNDNLIVIDRKIYKRNAEEDSDEKVIGVDIDRLAGCALIVEDKKIRFNSKFFTDSMHSELSDNMQAFKNKLKTLLDKEYEDLKKYRFEVKNSPKHWDLLYATSKLPDDHIESKDIREFFDKLIFAVSQPNEIELGKIIQKEIGECSRFNVLSADLVSNSFLIKMLDWFKKKGKDRGKEGEFFTAKDGEAFFKSMEEKIGNLICFGLGSSYPEELEEYGIEFEDENQQLKDFLNNEDERILNLIAIGETLPTAMRVHKTIRKQEKYRKYHSLIFMRLRSLRSVKTRELVIKSFESPRSYDLLVIDCESPNNEDSRILCDIYVQLYSVIKKTNNSSKKLIFITREIENFSGIKSYAILENCEQKSDEVCFTNLSEASRKKLLDKQIINLQGRRERPISFLKLLGFYTLSENLKDFAAAIDSSTLVKLISGEEIKLGTDLNTLGDIEDCYIERTFNQLVFLQEKILKSQLESDVFAISGINANSLARLVTDPGQIRSFGEIDWENTQFCKFIILDLEQATDQFATVCERYPKDQCKVHWLVRESKKLIWKKSQGDVTNLVTYKDSSEDSSNDNKVDNAAAERLKEDQLIDNNEQRRVVIISDTAGMGKTTVLTHLAREIIKTESGTWVIKINLSEFVEALAQEMENRKLNQHCFHGGDPGRAVEFFIDKLSKLKTDMEKKIFKTMIENHGRVALLFDGFDEILTDYREIVIDVLHAFENSTRVKKLFVSTRPHQGEALEEKLGTFSYAMEPFSETNQEDFVIRFWRKRLDFHEAEERIEKRLKTYAGAVIRKVAKSIDDRAKKFSGIPLQTRMLAEIFECQSINSEGERGDFESCQEFLNSENNEPRLPKKININSLYDLFVSRKFDIYVEEKMKMSRKYQGVEEVVESYEEKFNKRHQVLALNTLFEAEDLRTLGADLPILEFRNEYQVSEKNNGEEPKGFIIRIIDGKPQFIHRSYAEYFAANFFFHKLLMTHVSRGTHDPKVIKLMVNMLLEANFNVVRAFVNGLLLQYYSSPSAKQNEDNPFADGSLKSALAKARTSDGANILHVTVYEHHAGILKYVLNQFSDLDETWNQLITSTSSPDAELARTPVGLASYWGHWDELKLLLEHDRTRVEDLDDMHETPLHHTVLRGNLDMVKWLVQKGADINANNLNKETPLHKAAIEGHVDIAWWLFEDQGADVDVNDGGYQTPLHHAAIEGQLDMAQSLIHMGADVNAIALDNQTPIHYAAIDGESDIALLLLQEGADVDAIDDSNLTPLHHASARGHLDMAQCLLQNGADINATDSDKRTPLHYAVLGGHFNMTQYLFENGAHINATDSANRTALDYVGHGGYSHIAQRLGQNLANVNVTDGNSQTRLDYTVRRDRDMVQWFLQNGANSGSMTINEIKILAEQQGATVSGSK